VDLLARLAAIEVRRQALLARVGEMDPAALARRPPDGGWSLLEVIEHLVLVEEVVLGAPDRPPYEHPPRRTLGNRLRYLMVMGVLRFGIDVRAPSRRMIPAGECDLAALRQRWDRNQAWFRAHLADLDASGARRAVFRHPVSGPIDAHQAVTMLGAHLARHDGQVQRLLDAATAHAGTP